MINIQPSVAGKIEEGSAYRKCCPRQFISRVGDPMNVNSNLGMQHASNYYCYIRISKVDGAVLAVRNCVQPYAST